jgi:type II secretory pathway component PulM
MKQRLQRFLSLGLLLILAAVSGWQWQHQQQLQRQVSDSQAASAQLEQLVQTYLDRGGSAYQAAVQLTSLEQALQWLQQQRQQAGLPDGATQILIADDQLRLRLTRVSFNRLLGLIAQLHQGSNLHLQQAQVVASDTRPQVNADLHWVLY